MDAPDLIRIPLSRRGEVVGYAMVDAVDADLVAGRKWYFTNGYAITVNQTGGGTIYMHRLVTGLKTGDPRHVDHVNHDGLDNRRSNLRLVTRSQNLQNRRGATRTSTSSYRGVSWHKGGQKWIAQAKVEGHVHYLGLYVDELEAARVAARFRARHMTHSTEDPALL